MGLMLAALSGAGQGMADFASKAMDQDDKIDQLKAAAAIDLDRGMKQALFGAQLQLGMNRAQMGLRMGISPSVPTMQDPTGSGQSSAAPSPASAPDDSTSMPSTSAAGIGSLYGSAASSQGPAASGGAASYPAAPTAMPTASSSQPTTAGTGSSLTDALRAFAARNNMTMDQAMAYAQGNNEGLKSLLEVGMPQSTVGKVEWDKKRFASDPVALSDLNASIAKETQPTAYRQGSYVPGPDGKLHQVPAVPEGSTAVQNADGSFSVVPLVGGASAVEAESEATAAGKAKNNPTTVYGPDGKPQFSNQYIDARRGNASASPSVQPANGSADPTTPSPANAVGNFGGDPGVVAAQIADIKDPAERASAQAAFEKQLTNTPVNAPLTNTPGGLVGAQSANRTSAMNDLSAAMGTGNQQDVTPVLPSGFQSGQELSQQELSKKGSELSQQNQAAQGVIAKLQTIKQLAPNAIVGAESDRRDYLNGLQSLLSFIPGAKEATDYKTMSDLIDKNSAQIITSLRMGNSGGTDLLQTLLAGAFPNRHMTGSALQDAADQLIAQQQLNQSRATLLQRPYLNRDPKTYGQMELQFDQNADPRIWQMMNLPKQADRDAFIAKLPNGQAGAFLNSLNALSSMGVFK